MDITQTTADGVALFRLSGFLDSTTSAALQEAATACLDAGQVRIAMDLSEVGYVSSAGLRVVLMTAKRARAGDGVLVVCGLRNPVRETFVISGLDHLVAMADTVDDAVLAARAGQG